MKKISLLVIFLLANIGFNLFACQNAVVLRAANSLLQLETQYQKMLTLLKENLNREFIKEYCIPVENVKANPIMQIKPNVVINFALVFYRAFSVMSQEFEMFIKDTLDKLKTINENCPHLLKKIGDYKIDCAKKKLNFESTFDRAYCHGNKVIEHLSTAEYFMRSLLKDGGFRHAKYKLRDKSICDTCNVEAFSFAGDQDIFDVGAAFHHAPNCNHKLKNIEREKFYTNLFPSNLFLLHKIVYAIQFNEFYPINTPRRNSEKIFFSIKDSVQPHEINLPIDLIKIIVEYSDLDNLENEVYLLQQFILITKERLMYYRFASLIIKESKCDLGGSFFGSCDECMRAQTSRLL